MAAQNARQNQGPPSGARQRILRIGVLLGGKIVEERLIRERAPVTIGQSMRNTFSIPVEGLPLEFTLFALDEGRYSLRFLPRMDGRLSDSGGQVNTLDALKSRGAHNHGDYFQVPLTESARGKLSARRSHDPVHVRCGRRTCRAPTRAASAWAGAAAR